MPDPVQHSRLKITGKGNTGGRLGIRERVENRRNGEGKAEPSSLVKKGAKKPQTLGDLGHARKQCLIVSGFEQRAHLSDLTL